MAVLAIVKNLKKINEGYYPYEHGDGLKDNIFIFFIWQNIPVIVHVEFKPFFCCQTGISYVKFSFWADDVVYAER
jgi:hypothetical protein